MLSLLPLLPKARSGVDLSQEERLRVRAIMERRQRAQLEDSRPRSGGGGSGGAAAPSSSSTLSSMAPSFGRSVSSTSSKIHLAPEATSKEELEIEKLLALTRAYFRLVQKQVLVRS